MDELENGTPDDAKDWHPMVEKTRITDESSEDFGRTRIDSPEAADIAMEAAEEESKPENRNNESAARNTLSSTIHDHVLRNNLNEVNEEIENEGFLKRTKRQLSVLINGRDATTPEETRAMEDAEAAFESSKKLDELARSKKQND